jgi:hypothetical protein
MTPREPSFALHVEAAGRGAAVWASVDMGQGPPPPSRPLRPASADVVMPPGWFERLSGVSFEGKIGRALVRCDMAARETIAAENKRRQLQAWIRDLGFNACGNKEESQ